MMLTSELRDIRSLDQLVQYLHDELGWPIETDNVDEAFFDFRAAEVGLDGKFAARIKNIKQLRPLVSKQPWGIFFVEFERKKLPVVVLRRILSHLVVKKRASSNRSDMAAWHAHDLMFISAFGEESSDQREIAFAHFHQEQGDLPALRVLGWDGADTELKLAHVNSTLHQFLRWPSDLLDLDGWRTQWSRPFRHRIGHVIRTADSLAEVLASLARRIRAAAETIMSAETETGALRTLFAAFKTALIHDLTEQSFADTYAQTVTYGLLTAAISRTDMTEGEHGTALIAENVADIVPVTNPFLKDMLQTFLKIGGRNGSIDFDELGVQDVVELLRGDETDLPAILRDFGNRSRGEDPVIHFYEHFLSAYNKKLKIQRGVFYTPQPVVSFIVRSIHELLQTDFELEDGLASTITWREMANSRKDLKIPADTSPDSPFVVILDIATGTGTFFITIIEFIHRHLKAKFSREGIASLPKIHCPKLPIRSWSDYWNAYVPAHLLPRIFGYELMMAPYAIAHMRVPLKLTETGFTAWSELTEINRVNIYLTNSLEVGDDKQLRLSGFDALAHESVAVGAVKRHQRFTVVTGNPPYSIQSQNLSDSARRWVDDYRHISGIPVTERNALQFEKNIQDDYIKFIRLSQVAIDQATIGVVGLVTSHGYLDGATFRGMRWSLLQSFSHISVIDVHGNSNKRETSPDGSPDENVFDISQGVAISLMRKPLDSSSDNAVEVADLWGERIGGPGGGKYGWLQNHSSSDTEWTTTIPTEPLFLFKRSGGDVQREYEELPSLPDIMPLYSMGIKTSRDELVLDYEPTPILQRIERFRSAELDDEAICNELGIALKKGWNIARAREELKALGQLSLHIRQFLYRPFDLRLLFYHKAVVFSAAYPVMRNLISGRNMALVATRQTKDQWDVQCSSELVGHKSLGAYDANSVFPLYLYHDSETTQKSLVNEHRINLSGTFLTKLSVSLGIQKRGPHGLPLGLMPEDIFNYAFAVFHSPGYRTRYADYLKADFPRLPLSSNIEMFRALSALGGQLIGLHLLERTGPNVATLPVVGSNVVDALRLTEPGQGAPVGRVWINRDQYFTPVSPEVWNFRVGGYQVCHKWLKDRKGRTLSAEDIAHYGKIVAALDETIRLMAAIDDVIEEHGGWPGAFATSAK